MKLKAVQLSKEAHAKTRIKQTGTVEHIKDMHMAPVNIFEFAEAAVNYPILFIKQEDKFVPILMWGLEPEENLFITDGKWKGGFLPSELRFFPFVANHTDKENTLALGLYDNATIVNEEEGERVLNDEGEKSEWFENIVKHMHRVVEFEKQTKEVIEKIAAKDLFVPQELKVVTPDNKESIIGGFHVIDSKRFFKLTADELKEFCDNNILGTIYSHFISLNNLNKLTKLKYSPTKS